MQHVVIVELENKGNLPGEMARPGLKTPQRRGIGITPGIDRELKVIA